MAHSTGWPDQYRPETLDDMALDPPLRQRFERYLAGVALPRHLVLHGPPGVGKTTIAKIIASDLYVPASWPPTPLSPSALHAASPYRPSCRPQLGSTHPPPRRLLTNCRLPTVSSGLTGSGRLFKLTALTTVAIAPTTPSYALFPPQVRSTT